MLDNKLKIIQGNDKCFKNLIHDNIIGLKIIDDNIY